MNAIGKQLHIQMSDTMEIKITNDGREKWQSWEATIVFPEPPYISGGYYSYGEAIGYGKNEEEARQNLKKQIERMKEEISHLYYNTMKS